MSNKSYDFGGWATKNNIRCADDRVIIQDAFKDQDGSTVPLVWNHDHKSMEAVLGHALLENRPEGVYAYCTFNGTDLGNKAKEMVKHGDIRSLSIYANQLKQNGNNVVHGMIREVSLVLAGANLGAYIDTVIAHSDDHDEESIIYHPYGEDFEFYHSEEKGEEMENNEEVKHADAETEQNGGKTVKEIFDAMTEEQKQVVYYLAGIIADNAKKEATAQHSDLNENNNESMEDLEMKHNCFDNENVTVDSELLHSAMKDIISDAKKTGSLKESFSAYVGKCQDKALAHSITDIENLFPEAKAVNNTPYVIDRRQDWVAKVVNGVNHTPFARIKSTAVNVTADEARAKGYVKGNQKVEEVITALKRSTTPQTVYKLQKLDRDDIIDITDFDVVAFMKLEMRGKLQEELARAFLIGDGRLASSDDKINPLNIRPILGDSSVYTIAKSMTPAQNETEYAFAGRFIDEAIKARKEYKGSGNLTLYCTEDLLTDMLLLKDSLGHRIYKTEQELATALRVSEIVSVPVMENVVRTDSGYDYTLMGIFVNLSDYTVGADKGGATTMFDDFDLDFNKYEYLIETRCSGALTKPYSAITFEKKTTHEEANG